MAHARLAAVAAAAVILAAALAVALTVPAQAVTGQYVCMKNGNGDCMDMNTLSIGNPATEHTQANSRQWYFHQSGTDHGFAQGYIEAYNGLPLAAVNCTVGAGGGSVVLTTDTTQNGVVWDFFVDPLNGNFYYTNRRCSGGNGSWTRSLAFFGSTNSDLTIGDTDGNDGLFKALALH